MFRTLTASDRKTLIRFAHELPKMDETRRVILSGLQKVTNRPWMKEVNRRAYRDGRAFMTYLVGLEPGDAVAATGNNSKFYEGLIEQQPNGLWPFKRRWGALTDRGPSGGKVDGARFDQFDLNKEMARRLLKAEYTKRLRRGYMDAFKSQPVGQYPVGLSRIAPFGWGIQSITKCVPALRNLLEAVQNAIKETAAEDAFDLVAELETAQVELEKLPDSSMAREVEKRLRGPLEHMRGNPRFVPEPARIIKELRVLTAYLARQLAKCNV